MRKFNTNKIKDSWVDYTEDDLKFQVRPFKLLSLTNLPNDDGIHMEQLWNIFNYIVTDWKGIENESGPMECNEENKKIVFEYDQELVSFCVGKAAEMREGVTGKELKNSGNSQIGKEKV